MIRGGSRYVVTPLTARPMSLNAVQLDTQSLIELYYTVYNPELFETQRMTETSQLQLEG